MKNFLILMLFFSATVTFAQSKKQVEPVKQSVESEDIKKEMKDIPISDIAVPDAELEKLEEAIEEELELLEEEAEEMEMKETEEIDEIKVEEMKKKKGNEKLKIQSGTEPESSDE